MKRIILTIFAFSIGILTYAKEDETRSTVVNVEIASSDLIRIEAKYTTLTVETWDKNEVEIEATVRFDGKITNNIQEFLDDFEKRVNENIMARGGELIIETDLDIPNKIQIGGKSVGINISYGDELKVFYSIKSPGTNTYEISTSYEDVKLLGNFSDVKFTQYSGDLEAGHIEKATMNMKYGSAEIKSLGEAKLEIYEQEINVQNTNRLKLNAKYSDLELRKVGLIDADSYESDFQIESIDEINGTYKYGDIKITDNLGRSDLSLYEVDIEANRIGQLKLSNSKYSKFKIEDINQMTFTQSYEDETEIGTLGSFRSFNSKYGNHSIDLLTDKFELNAYEDEVNIEEVATSATQIEIDGKYIDASLGIEDIPFILKSNIKYGRVDYDKSSVDVRRYIKDGDQLEIEVQSKNSTQNALSISIKGYEVKVDLN